MFTQPEFKLLLFLAVSWSYGKWFKLTDRNTVPMFDHNVVKVWI